MKAVIILTDDDGNSWEGELTLDRRDDRAATRGRTGKDRAAVRAAKSGQVEQEKRNIDFSLPPRPFIKRYAAGASGPKKFAILLARMANGDLKTEIAVSEIEKQWNKMKQPMSGSFNGAHATRAKDAGWVDSPKYGVYKLLGGWRGALPIG